MRTEHPYRGRTAILGSKHGKASLIALPLLGTLGLRVSTMEVDTDLLGTFAGDVPRTLPVREAAIAKARLAMSETGCALGLASEGTIGPDPQVPFLVSDRELLVLVDDETGTVYQESVRSMDIQATSTAVRPGEDLEAFLARAGFPSHRLIVRPAGIEPIDLPADRLFKGISDRGQLRRAIEACASASPTGQAQVESDLRAHCSPSRRTIIARAAWQLGFRLASRCPSCRAPGWGVVDELRGLPCCMCKEWVPRAPRGLVLGCGQCWHRVERPDGRTAEDPGRCSSCNP